MTNIMNGIVLGNTVHNLRKEASLVHMFLITADVCFLFSAQKRNTELSQQCLV